MKTLWENSERFEMRLSSAERLAKELKPSFVYVLKIDEKLQPVEAFLVHILGKNLGTILKRLRKEQSKGDLAVNQKKISMIAHSVGERLEPTGAALREALERLCGPDIQRYVDEKRTQIRGLGYDPFSYEAKVSMLVQSKKDFVDAFLGLCEIEVSDFRVFETRFGIKLPVNECELTSGKLRIEPTPSDKCQITVRGVSLTPPATFEGEVIFPAIPDLEPDLMKALIRSKFFDLNFEQGQINLRTKAEEINTAAYTLDEWSSYFRLVATLASGEGTIRIRLSKGFDLSLPIEQKLQGAIPGEADYFQNVIKDLVSLLSLAGAPTTGRFHFKDLANQAKQIRSVKALMDGDPKLSPLTFVVNSVEGYEPIQRTQILYCNILSVGEVTLVYHAVADIVSSLENNSIRWTSEKLEARGLQQLGDDPKEFDQYIKSTKLETGLSIVIAYNNQDA